MAGVQLGVVRVALDVRALWRARVDVAHTLVVRQEVDAISHPAGAGQVALQHDEPLELAAATGIDPEVASGAATVTLPTRGVRRVTTQHHAAVGATGEGTGRAVR